MFIVFIFYWIVNGFVIKDVIIVGLIMYEIGFWCVEIFGLGVVMG